MKKSEVQIPPNMLGESEGVLDYYRDLIVNGDSRGMPCAPRMAEIISTRRPPTGDTDTAHFSGLKNLNETAGPSYFAKIHKEAKRHGVKVSKDMHFNASMADHRGGGDPAAWQMAGCGRDHYRKLLESRGEVSSDLGVKATDRTKEILMKKQAAFNKRQAKVAERQAAYAEKVGG